MGKGRRFLPRGYPCYSLVACQCLQDPRESLIKHRKHMQLIQEHTRSPVTFDKFDSGASSVEVAWITVKLKSMCWSGGRLLGRT